MKCSNCGKDRVLTMGFRCDDCLCPDCDGSGYGIHAITGETIEYTDGTLEICGTCEGTGERTDL